MNLCAESFTIYASLSNIYFSSFIYDCFYRTGRERTIWAHRGREIDSFPLSRRYLSLDFSLFENGPPEGRWAAQSEWTVGPHHHSCPGYAPLLTALIVGQLIIAMFPVFRRYSTLSPRSDRILGCHENALIYDAIRHKFQIFGFCFCVRFSIFFMRDKTEKLKIFLWRYAL